MVLGCVLRHCDGQRVSAEQSARRVEPLVPVDLMVDHGVMIDHFGRKGALDLSMKLESQRNHERSS